MDLSLPRGIRDIDPEEYEKHERIIDSFRSTARLMNFKLMEPATLENISLLTAKSGPDIQKEIYSFRDKAGREVGLRFDLTVGITRYVCSRKDLLMPQRLGAVGTVWRYDEPQHARYRAFNQWDVEIFGKDSVDYDAEVIEFAYRFFKSLSLDFSIHVGDRKIAEDILAKKLGSRTSEERQELLRLIDKSSKKTKEELLSEYSAKGFTEHEVLSALELAGIKGSEVALKKIKENADTSRLEYLLDSLRSRSVTNFIFDLGVVRGLDYYTGVVFEVYDNKRADLGALCGGGRYNVLPRIFGREDLFATGTAGGIERIALSLEKSRGRELNVYVAAVNKEAFRQALTIASELRNAGISTETGTSDTSLRKSLEYCSAKKIRLVIILGPEELSKGEVKLRDMESGKETICQRDNIVQKVRELL